MKKYYKYLMLMVIAVSLAACSDDDEEILQPTGTNENKFAVPADETGPEAKLRRDFFDRLGSYLIFNDLLSRDYVGKDSEGNDVYKEERVDFNYNINSEGYDDPDFEYLTDIESKRAAAKLIEDYIFPHISGGAMTPFSIMPVETISVMEWGWPTQKPTTSCIRCLAIAVGDWLALPEEDRAEYSADVLSALVSSKFNSYSPEASDFLNLSYEFNRDYLVDLDPNWNREDMSVVYECGFLSYSKYSRIESDRLPYSSTDFNDYFNVVMSTSEEDFMAQYGQYYRMVNKFNAMKDAITGLGYKF